MHVPVILLYIYAPSPFCLKGVLTLERADYICSDPDWQTNLHITLRRSGKRKPSRSFWSTVGGGGWGWGGWSFCFSSAMFVICVSRSLASLLCFLVKHFICKCLAGKQNPPSKSRAQKSPSFFFFFFFFWSLEQKADRFLTESVSQQIRVKMTNHWGHKHSEGQTPWDAFSALHKGGAGFLYLS